MKVLLSAYACEPGVGSEGGIGWNWTRQVALRNPCVLITRKNNVQAIRAAAEREGLDNLRVVGFDLPYWMRFWKRKGRGALAYFYLWQLSQIPLARRLDREHDFDLVQHLTFASSWIPSGLAFVGKPFLWGPVGQHPRIPQAFVDGAESRREGFKAGIKRFLLAWDPFLHATMGRATRILSLGSEFESSGAIPSGAKLERLPACGVERLHGGPKQAGHVLFSGRLVALKGPILALGAFRQALRDHPELRMTFLGSGPLEERLRSQAQAWGIEERVTFAGRLPLDEALETMASAEIFLFPSFEGAGMVVPEAMAAGAVVLCLKFGGPGDMVADGRGLGVELGATAAETVDNLAKGLRRLVEEPDLCRKLRTRASAWIQGEMLWGAKGDRLQAIYATVIQETEQGRT